MTRKKALCFFSPTLPASVKKAKHFKPLSLFLLLLAAMLFSAHSAEAIGFIGTYPGSAAQIGFNYIFLPVPTTASDGLGGTKYTYDLSMTAGASMNVSGGTTPVLYSSTTFTSYTITVDINPSFTNVTFLAYAPPQGSQLQFGGGITLGGPAGLITGSGMPSTLPPLSNWTTAHSFGLTLDYSSNGAYTIAYYVGADKPQGDCKRCEDEQSAALQMLNMTRPGQPVRGDPITVGTGNLFEKATDYATAGQNPLAFTRYYNSQPMTSVTTYATTLGANWRSTYDRYLHISPTTGTATSVIAERPDGQVISFVWTGTAWVTDTDVDYTLTQSGSTWTLTDHNDTVETYSASSGKGTLSTIALRNGYTQTLTYSSGVLQSVADSYSRSFAFTYSSGLISKVTTPDSSSTGITFAYTSGNLTGVTYPTSTATTLTYAYENSSFPHALTGIIDENSNRYATWAYDTQGRATSSKLGDTLGADLTTVAYNSDGTVTVTNALGVADTYTFANLQNVPKVTGISRAATSTTAAATESFAYDGNGYTSSVTDWNGNTTTYTNDSHGDPTTIVEASGSSVARTTTVVL